MKFIHTSDWHLGNRMHDIDRTDEYSSFLKWLKTEITQSQAETLIVSGDIYDSLNPQIEYRRQYIEFLASLIGTKCKNIVIIGGNHDSAALLDSEKDILDILNIHVIGSAANLSPDKLVFELYGTNCGQDGKPEAIGICAAIPYMREHELRQYAKTDNATEKNFSDKAFEQVYSQAYSAACKLRAGRNIPIIATGHLYAANIDGRLAGNEKETKADDGTRVLDIVGNLGSVHASSFGTGFDYVALGHIHYAAKAEKNPKIWYSGSPFILGFDEAGYERNILEVNITPQEKNNSGKHPFSVDVQKITVPQTAEYKRISGTWEEIEKAMNDYSGSKKSSEIPAYIEICFKPQDGINIHENIDNAMQNLPENIKIVSRKAIKTDMPAYTAQSMDIREIKNIDQEEIFKMLILKENSLEISLCETEEAKNQKKAELISKYMPIFREAAKLAENEETL